MMYKRVHLVFTSCFPCGSFIAVQHVQALSKHCCSFDVCFSGAASCGFSLNKLKTTRLQDLKNDTSENNWALSFIVAGQLLFAILMCKKSLPMIIKNSQQCSKICHRPGDYFQCFLNVCFLQSGNGFPQWDKLNLP